jgi:hypothetical protein
MRHTFTPKSQRAQLDREYRARAAATLFLALASAAAIGVIALLPAFFRVSTAERSALQTIATDKAGSSADAESAQSELSAAGSLVALLATGRGAPRLSDAIRQISSVRSDISITSLSVDREGTSSIAAVIQGVAPTRDKLISFQGRLQGLAPGASVDLPIAELAKSSYIDFSIRLVAQLP